jgi:hypothetical protein
MSGWWSLVSGLVGALLVFIFQAVIEAWRNKREKLGLLRLLLAEIEHNAEVTNTIGERKRDLLDSPDLLRSIKTETWQDVRKGATRLFPATLTEALNDYYSPLETLLTLLQFENRESDMADRWFRGTMKEQAPEKEVALTRNPYYEYRDRALQAQEKAQKRIEKYLQRFAVRLNPHTVRCLALAQKFLSVRGMHHQCRWLNNSAKGYSIREDQLYWMPNFRKTFSQHLGE